MSLAATAGFTSLTLALQQPQDSSVSAPASANTQNNSQSSVNVTDDGGNSIRVDATSSDNTQADSAGTSTTPSMSGQITVNEEMIPLSPGTTQRIYTDDNGNQHTVTVTIDGKSTTVNSESSSSSVTISNSSSTSIEHNTTRGSPRR